MKRGGGWVGPFEDERRVVYTVPEETIEKVR